jgi:hypothetical protein
MKALFRFLVSSFCFIPATVYCQQFQNGDLEGVVSGGGTLPPFWLNVPYNDPNCLALNPFEDSPDLTDLNGPLPGSICGNAFSGNTFISGLIGGVSIIPNSFWHEGIMQTVSDFEVSRQYILCFRQAVVKNGNALDNSGSWAIYLDTSLIGVTSPTYSEEPFCSANLIWELRQYIFTAASESHTIKFLPMDDDTNYNASTTDTTGALRMGIDSISLSIVTGIEEKEQDLGITLYPNPTKHQLNITLEKPFSGRLSISNFLGQEVYILPNTNARSKFNLDVGALPAGVYVLGFENDKGVVRKRFVKE